MKISVIVPIYNTEQYLEECIDSLINQTLPFYEIILVNDGSTDGCGEICEEYSKKYNNIILISQENKGLSEARNAGIRMATGDYLIFLDSDDYFKKNTMEKLTHEIIGTQLDILFYGADVLCEIQENKDLKDIYKRESQFNGYIMTGVEYLRKVYRHNYIISACLAAYRTEFIRENNFYFPKGLLHEDNSFCLQTVINAKSIKCISDRLYVSRRRENSIVTSSYSLKRCEDLIENQLLEWKYIKEYQIKDNSICDFGIKFAANEAINVIYILSNSNCDVEEMIHGFVSKFMQCWIDSISVKGLSWDALILVLKLLQNPNYTFRYNIEIIKEAREYLQLRLEDKLAQLPLNAGMKVGVYGIGLHTTRLLDTYREYNGDIKCDYFFVVSHSDGICNFMNRPVLTCNQIPEDVDYIIVSSLLYQNEITENLKKYGINTSKIYTLYCGDEWFDMVVALGVL